MDIGIFFRKFGNLFFLYVGTSIFICDIIFLFLILKFFLLDLSIMQANPMSFAFDFLIKLTHSKLDLPVVITSSTISTFEFFFIEKPLLSLNLFLTL